MKGGPKEKRLAAQFIPKFFSNFPELADAAINAQLDLCEDEDVSVGLTINIVALVRSAHLGMLRERVYIAPCACVVNSPCIAAVVFMINFCVPDCGM